MGEISMRRVIALAALTVALGLPLAGCGDNQTAPPEKARRVVQQFVNEMIERHDVDAALAYAPGLRTSIEVELVHVVKDRLHQVGSVRAGCPDETFFPLPDQGLCYRVRLRGDPVPDPNAPGLSTIAYGWEYIVVDGDPPTVRAFNFEGGGRYVKSKAVSP